MKKTFFFLFIFCAAHTMHSQDLGVSVSGLGFFPMGGTAKAPPISGFSVDLNWWSPDKGFPVFGIVGFGYHREFPTKLETIQYTNSTGSHKGDLMQYSSGFSTRYGWEIVQPTQHMSVYGGVGSTIFRVRQEFKTATPLQQGDYVTDSYGNTWYAGYSGANGFSNLAITMNAFAGVMYEFPWFNIFATGSFNYNSGDITPFTKAIGVNGGVFYPFLRR